MYSKLRSLSTPKFSCFNVSNDGIEDKRITFLRLQLTASEYPQVLGMSSLIHCDVTPPCKLSLFQGENLARDLVTEKNIQRHLCYLHGGPLAQVSFVQPHTLHLERYAEACV